MIILCRSRACIIVTIAIQVFKRATLIRPLPYVRGARLQIRCVATPSAARCHVAAVEPLHSATWRRLSLSILPRG